MMAKKRPPGKDRVRAVWGPKEPLKVFNLYMNSFDMVYSEQNTFENAHSSTLDMFS
jgi:hypothetical protein